MKSAAAHRPLLLWFDLTRNHATEALILPFNTACRCLLQSPAEWLAAQREPMPDMICIHYDCPDLPGLTLLQEIKLRFPSIPVTMFTVQHSEELAIWAMRSRVWEYVVLPLCAGEIQRYLHALEQLCELRRNAGFSSKSAPIEHGPSLPDSIRLTTDHQKHKALHNVLQFIDQNYCESIDQKDLAKRCGMTTFRFSRLFKEVYGLGFMDYVLGKRMDSAKDLLDNSQMPITSIGYEVGFKDPSYFARAFKQYAGCTPSEYRQIRRNEVPVADDVLTQVIDSLARSAEA